MLSISQQVIQGLLFNNVHMFFFLMKEKPGYFYVACALVINYHTVYYVDVLLMYYYILDQNPTPSIVSISSFTPVSFLEISLQLHTD